MQQPCFFSTLSELSDYVNSMNVEDTDQTKGEAYVVIPKQEGHEECCADKGKAEKETGPRYPYPDSPKELPSHNMRDAIMQLIMPRVVSGLVDKVGEIETEFKEFTTADTFKTHDIKRDFAMLLTKFKELKKTMREDRETTSRIMNDTFIEITTLSAKLADLTELVTKQKIE